LFTFVCPLALVVAGSRSLRGALGIFLESPLYAVSSNRDLRRWDSVAAGEVSEIPESTSEKSESSGEGARLRALALEGGGEEEEEAGEGRRLRDLAWGRGEWGEWGGCGEGGSPWPWAQRRGPTSL